MSQAVILDRDAKCWRLVVKTTSPREMLDTITHYDDTCHQIWNLMGNWGSLEVEGGRAAESAPPLPASPQSTKMSATFSPSCLVRRIETRITLMDLAFPKRNGTICTGMLASLIRPEPRVKVFCFILFFFLSRRREKEKKENFMLFCFSFPQGRWNAGLGGACQDPLWPKGGLLPPHPSLKGSLLPQMDGGGGMEGLEEGCLLSHGVFLRYALRWANRLPQRLLVRTALQSKRLGAPRQRQRPYECEDSKSGFSTSARTRPPTVLVLPRQSVKSLKNFGPPVMLCLLAEKQKGGDEVTR